MLKVIFWGRGVGCVDCNGLGKEGWDVLTVMVCGRGMIRVEYNGLWGRDDMC